MAPARRLPDWRTASPNFAEFDTFYKNCYQIVNQRTSGSSPAWTYILRRGPQSSPRITPREYVRGRQSEGKTGRYGRPESGGKILRGFTNEFIRYSSQVSDDDRRLLGVHIHDSHPHAHHPAGILL
jgi:hypothetical protein